MSIGLTPAASALVYDPFSNLGMADPYPLYARLRDEAPAYHNPDRGFWALSRFDDVQTAARDWETFSSAPCVDPDYVGVRLRINSFLDMDPPIHDVLRRIVKAHFTPKAIKEFEAVTVGIADELIDCLVEAGKVDLASDLAWVLPLKATMALLGVPAADFAFLRDTFDRLWHENRLWIEPAPDAPSRVAAASLREYFAATLVERATRPGGEDVLSTVAEAYAADLATLDQLAEVCIVLYIAGYETTANLLSSALLVLAENPVQRAWLAANPDGLPDAVEEFLRFDAPVQVLARDTTKPVELHGQRLPAGARVLLLYGAANRDPRRFPDPDRLDVTRPVVRHLAFGSGIHHCLGAPLARLEARIAIGRLLARMPEYAISGAVIRNTNMVSTRGITSLPVVVETS
jgi:cytochrome P450